MVKPLKYVLGSVFCMDTEAQLKAEIKKWSARLEESLAGARPLGEKGVEMMTNIRAYQSDSLHFLQKGDPVRAFEALVWAWAYLQIGKDLGTVS